jgi:hypothetical protein
LHSSQLNFGLMNIVEAAKSAQEPSRIPSPFKSATRSPFWLFCINMYPVLVAASIPWSTTAIAILMIVWFFVLIPTIEPHLFLRFLKHPACFLPIAFFALAVIGTLWADGPWSARLHGVSPVAKLLAIAFLFYHFGRSTRGMWVYAAFLVSCALLHVMSWIVAFDPRIALKAALHEDYYGVVVNGVPVKNYIDQSQEFALCAVALAYPIVTLLREKRDVPGGVTPCGLAELCRQHGVRDRVAHGAGHDADHARGICAASPKMAERRDHIVRDDCVHRIGNVASVALEGPNRLNGLSIVRKTERSDLGRVAARILE